jgi:NADH-quinone oxidoreductase subunit G
MGERLNKPGLNATEMLEKAATDGWDFLYVAGANPAARFSKKLWRDARSKLKFLVVQDLFLTETAGQADVVLPTLTAMEKGGTFLNIERRVQPLLPGKEVPDDLFSDGEIFARLLELLKLNLTNATEFDSQLNPGTRLPAQPAQEGKIPSAKQDSQEGKLRASFAHALFDQGVRINHDPHVSQLTQSPRIRINPLDAFKSNIANGNKISVNMNGNGVTGIAKLDENVAPGTVVLPLGFDDFPVYNLSPNLLNGLPVELNTTFLAEEKSHA